MRVAKTVHLLPPTKAEMARSTQGYGSRGGAATAGEEATFPQWLKPFKVKNTRFKRGQSQWPPPQIFKNLMWKPAVMSFFSKLCFQKLLVAHGCYGFWKLENITALWNYLEQEDMIRINEMKGNSG